MVNLGLGVRGREPSETRCFSQHIKGNCCPRAGSWRMLTPDDLAYVVFVCLEKDSILASSSAVFREATGKRFEASDLESGMMNS